MLILKGIREASLGHWLWLTVGTAVAANSRGPQFESSHRKTVMSEMYLFNSQLHWKGDNKEKETIDGPFVKKAPHSATCFASIFKFWPLPASFSLFLLFQYSLYKIKFSNECIRNADLWSWKQSLNQLSHNNYQLFLFMKFVNESSCKTNQVFIFYSSTVWPDGKIISQY